MWEESEAANHPCVESTYCFRGDFCCDFRR